MRSMITTWRAASALLALVGCCLTTHAQEPAPAPADLFQLVDRTISSVQPGAEVVSSQPVQVDLNLLARQGVGHMLNLNVAPDRALASVVERVTHRAPMRFTVAGRFGEYEQGSFIIVVYEDVAVGVVRLPELNELYQLQYTSEGVHLIQQIDSSKYPPEQCYQADGPAIDLPAELPVKPPRHASGASLGRGGCDAPPPVYDLVMLYTHLARQAMGGTNAAIAQCQLAVEVGNEAYANSQIGVHLRLVHTMETMYDEPGEPSDEDWMEPWLSWVIIMGMGPRNEYAADFVSMLTSRGSGIGQCGPGETDAYSCVQWQRAVNTWTLVHEMGHNHGCAHNRDEDSDCACSGHAHGWHFTGDSGIHWGTVMSYAGNRIGHFSNPDIDFDGQPTGVLIGDPDEAHNAQVHSAWLPWCEAYRLTRSDIWVDFDWGWPHAEEGTFANPYDTLTEGIDTIVTGVGPSELPRLWIKGGSCSDTGTFDKPMAIHACGEDVYIGVQP